MRLVSLQTVWSLVKGGISPGSMKNVGQRVLVQRFKWALWSRFAPPTRTNNYAPLVPARCANQDYRTPFSPGLCHEPGLKTCSNEPLLPRSYDASSSIDSGNRCAINVDRFGNRCFDASGRRRCNHTTGQTLHLPSLYYIRCTHLSIFFILSNLLPKHHSTSPTSSLSLSFQ
jgi:hypothetical protein